jgi:apolipoprotein N-acyltransferase
MKNNKYLPFIWFILGFGLFMATRASRIIPHWGAAIYVAPIFILAFIRSLPAKKGSWFTLLGFILSLNIAMWGLFDAGGTVATIAYNLVRNSILAILFSIPYIADQSIYRFVKGRKLLSTLAFPVAVTATQFLISLEGPFDGDMVSAVYAQGSLDFLQMASLTGLWGFVFIYSWLAAVINYGWEKEFKWAEIRSVTFTFILMLTVLFGFGTIKTAGWEQPETDTVKIASVFLIPADGQWFDGTGLFSQEISPYEETLSKIGNLTQSAASNGAKIVAFQETAIKIDETNEADLIARSQMIASEHRVYLSLGYGVFPAEGKGWNKNILISETGELVIDYRKRFLLGLGDMFGETQFYNKGPEVIQSVDTPYGRLGVSICRDMSFPAYARQAGEQQVDILFNPSFDYPKTTGEMYSLRAIENGFSMVRPVYNGYSYAVDPHGQLLASMDSDLTDTGIMYADVPTQGINTLYSNIGDLLAWICVIGLLGFIPLNMILRRKQKKDADQ